MAGESDPDILTCDLGQELTMRDIAVKADLIIFDLRLSGRHSRVGRGKPGQRLRYRSQRDLTGSLLQRRTHFVRAEAYLRRRLTLRFRLVQLLNFFLK